MHVISHAKNVATQTAHPDSRSALDQWYRLVKRAAWGNFSEVRQLFPATDKVGD